MSLSDTKDLCQSRSLDEVRARIFYLASDVEEASRPAAMLLRAVAESISEGAETPQSLNGRDGLSSLAATLRYAQANSLRANGYVTPVKR